MDQASQIKFVVWVFILRPDFSTPKEKQSHIDKINKFFYTSLGWENNLGHTFEDYTNIMLRIES